MNIKDFSASLKAKQKELDTLMRRELPIKVGRMAKDHYQDNFRKGGFVNGGLQHWPQTTIQPSSEGRRGRPVRRKASNESMSGRVHRPARVIITAFGLGVSGVLEARIVAQGAVDSSRQNVARNRSVSA
jgi:hypothetical protein